MKKIIVGVAFLIILVLMLIVFHVSLLGVISGIKFTTMYLLPWIALYFLIRLVKILEERK